MGSAQIRFGARPAGLDACARGAAIAKSLGRGDLVVRAALVYGTELATGLRDERMIELLRKHGGNLSAVARDMGKDRVQIRRWCQRMEIDLTDFRS